MRTKLLVVLSLVVICAVAYAYFRKKEEAAEQSAARAAEERERETRRRRWDDDDDFDDAEDDRGGSSRDRLARRAERENARHERYVSQFEIVSLGPTPATLTPDGIIAALQENAPAFEDCIEAAGGRTTYIETMRAQRAQQRAERERTEAALTPEQREAERRERLEVRRGRPTDRVMRFDVRPDGTVDPESIELEPQVPEPFAPCFVANLTALRIADVGSEGARVEMPMRGPRRIRPDGGIPPF